MKHIKPYNESSKGYLVNKIVIDPQYGSVPKDVKDAIFEKRRGGQNSYFRYYMMDDLVKPLSEHKDPSKAVFYDEKSKNDKNPYAYEIGTNIITDWLLSEGFAPNAEIIFLIWW